MRMPGPPMPAGPRYAPLPPPRKQLSAGQRSKLVSLFVVLLLLGTALGYLVALMLPTQYAARVTIQYNIANQNTGDFLKTDRNLTTQQVLLTSRNVLQPVADANGITVESLAKKISVTNPDKSSIIQLEVRDDTREGGINLANAIAKQYLTVSNASSPKGYVQTQLDAVKKQQATPQPGATAADTAALGARAAALQAQLDGMNITANQSTVLSQAYSLDAPAFPNVSIAGFTGGVCGLLIALMTAVTLTRRWTRS